MKTKNWKVSKVSPQKIPSFSCSGGLVYFESTQESLHTASLDLSTPVCQGNELDLSDTDYVLRVLELAKLEQLAISLQFEREKPLYDVNSPHRHQMQTIRDNILSLETRNQKLKTLTQTEKREGNSCHREHFLLSLMLQKKILGQDQASRNTSKTGSNRKTSTQQCRCPFLCFLDVS